MSKNQRKKLAKLERWVGMDPMAEAVAVFW